MSDSGIDSYRSYSDEINISELFDVIWDNKLFLSIWTSLFALIALIYSFTLTNIYTAESLLAPSTSGNTSSSLISQYAGIASMAGITLPQSSTGMSEKDLALSLLKSKGLLQRLIEKYDILPDLIAAKNWNANTKLISYDLKLYDINKNAWIREVKPPYKQIPSLQEAFFFFNEAISVSEDNKTGTISLKVEHLSPEIAYKWSLAIIQEVNEYVADMRINEAQLSIEYLNEQIRITPYPELRAMFYELIQQHTQSMLLAKVRPEYALTTIDPPLIPEKKSAPSRASIISLLTFLGGILGAAIILIRHYIYNHKDPIHLNLRNT